MLTSGDPGGFQPQQPRRMWMGTDLLFYRLTGPFTRACG